MAAVAHMFRSGAYVQALSVAVRPSVSMNAR